MCVSAKSYYNAKESPVIYQWLPGDCLVTNAYVQETGRFTRYRGALNVVYGDKISQSSSDGVLTFPLRRYEHNAQNDIEGYESGDAVSCYVDYSGHDVKYIDGRRVVRLAPFADEPGHLAMNWYYIYLTSFTLLIISTCCCCCAGISAAEDDRSDQGQTPAERRRAAAEKRRTEAKKKADAEAKAEAKKKEAETKKKAKADAEAKKKADAEAKAEAKAEAEAKKKAKVLAEIEAKAALKAHREAKARDMAAEIAEAKRRGRELGEAKAAAEATARDAVARQAHVNAVAEVQTETEIALRAQQDAAALEEAADNFHLRTLHVKGPNPKPPGRK